MGVTTAGWKIEIFENPILCLNLADRLILHIGHIGFHRFVDLEGQHIGLAVQFQKPFVPASHTQKYYS